MVPGYLLLVIARLSRPLGTHKNQHWADFMNIDIGWDRAIITSGNSLPGSGRFCCFHEIKVESTYWICGPWTGCRAGIWHCLTGEMLWIRIQARTAINIEIGWRYRLSIIYQGFILEWRQPSVPGLIIFYGLLEPSSIEGAAQPGFLATVKSFLNKEMGWS